MGKLFLHVFHGRNNSQEMFCDVLNRLQIGPSTDSDQEIFASRIVKRTDPEYVSNVHPLLPSG